MIYKSKIALVMEETEPTVCYQHMLVVCRLILKWPFESILINASNHTPGVGGTKSMSAKEKNHYSLLFFFHA